jgi:hypothetical protein
MKESDVEAFAEEAPVCDDQANGLLENAVNNVQGQLGVISDQ